MIRFSAGLVAVAIGMLIGGIATSKLLLVYIAIVLSAVALVALVIGVALKPKELFGEERGTAPAQAGASPVVSAQASDREDQNRPNGYLTSAPAQGEAAAGPGAAFAGTGQAASSQLRGTRENRAGDDSRPSQVTASPFPAARQAAAPFGAQAVGEPPASWGPAVHGRETAPRPPSVSAPSVFAPHHTASTSAAAPGAGPDVGRPDWFNPSGKAASASGPAPGTGAAWSWTDTTVPGDKEAEERGKPADVPARANDGGPARYSWLDEKSAGTVPAGTVPAGTVPAGTVPAGTVRAGTVPADREGAVPESGSPASPVDAGPQDVVVPDALASPETPDAGTTDPETPGSETPGSETREATAPGVDGEVNAGKDADSHLAATAEADETDTPSRVRGSAAGASAAGAPAPEAGEPEVPGEPEGEPSAATAAADDAGLVTVVRGVPRFHQRDCVLIRFMSDDDTQKLSVAEAEEAGCTPCAACQPS